jgi:DNA-directed RNA polymerase subunit E'/Rpb7
MDTTVIEKRICLESKFLNSNYEQHILDKANQDTKNECSQNYGFIIRIIRILDILDHEINRVNADNVFTVKFEAESLKPEPDKIFRGSVCMIYKDGIFINVLDKQKILIPAYTLADVYDFNLEKNSYVGKDDEDDVIKEGTVLSVKITASQYNNLNFSCFGTIV